MLSDFLVASCVPDGGVYRYRLHYDEKIEFKQKISMPSPMYLQLEKNSLWAVLRNPFSESKESGTAEYDVDTGRQISNVFSTRGEVACHIAVDDKDIYCANYISGSVFKSPSQIVNHTGRGTNPKRQSSPHVHSVVFSPDKCYILSCDLGLDTVFVYDRNLNIVSTSRVPSGAGARHLVFSGDGRFVYCANEMGGSISVFSFENGALSYIHTLSILPNNFYGDASAAAIKISKDGNILYVTERAAQSIVTISAEGSDLSIISHTNCHGKEPRDFTLLADEQYAVCTNQFSDTVALFKINEDRTPSYLNSFEVSAPLCAVEIL